MIYQIKESHDINSDHVIRWARANVTLSIEVTTDKKTGETTFEWPKSPNLNDLKARAIAGRWRKWFLDL